MVAKVRKFTTIFLSDFRKNYVIKLVLLTTLLSSIVILLNLDINFPKSGFSVGIIIISRAVNLLFVGFLLFCSFFLAKVIMGSDFYDEFVLNDSAILYSFFLVLVFNSLCHVFFGYVYGAGISICVLALCISYVIWKIHLRIYRENVFNFLKRTAFIFMVFVIYGGIFFWIFRSDTETLLNKVSNQELDLFSNRLLSLGVFFIIDLCLIPILILIINTLYILFRSKQYKFEENIKHFKLAKNIISEFGLPNLGYIRLWPEKSFFFSETKRSFISYKISYGVAVSLGGPVGERQEFQDLTDKFRKYCRQNNLGCAFVQVPFDELSFYKKSGLNIIRNGQDAIIDLNRFCSTTVKERKLRHVCSRCKREGFSFQVFKPPHSDELLIKLRGISETWLTNRNEQEKSFSQGYFDENYLNQNNIFVLLDQNREIIAFVNQVFSFREREAQIDITRYIGGLFSYTMTYLLSQIFCYFYENGFEYGNYGMAPLAKTDRCRRYKDKFSPDWRDLFLVYEGGIIELIRIIFALSKIMDKIL